MSQRSVQGDENNVPSPFSSPPQNPPNAFEFNDANDHNEIPANFAGNITPDVLDPPLNDKVDAMTQTDKFEIATQTCKFYLNIILQSVC